MPPLRALVPLALAAALVPWTGCEGPLPIEYETEHLRIGADRLLCRGDLERFEQTIAFVEDDLGIELEHTIHVYVWGDSTWFGRENECSSLSSGGCYHQRTETIYTGRGSILHELVHAVVDNRERNVFFDEGVAFAYEDDPVTFGYSAPSANLQVTENDEIFDGWTAGHFVRWLRQEWGGHKLGRLARSEGEFRASFEAIYGVSLAEAEERYLAESPAVYPPLRDCTGPEFSPDPISQGWRAEVELGCDASGVRAGPTGLFSYRTLVIPEDGRYSFASNSAWIGAYRCEDGPSDTPYDSPVFEQDDIPSVYTGMYGSFARFFAGHEVHTVELRRGRYNFSVGLEGYEGGSASIRVWSALEQVPIEGD